MNRFYRECTQSETISSSRSAVQSVLRCYAIVVLEASDPSDRKYFPFVDVFCICFLVNSTFFKVKNYESSWIKKVWKNYTIKADYTIVSIGRENLMPLFCHCNVQMVSFEKSKNYATTRNRNNIFVTKTFTKDVYIPNSETICWLTPSWFILLTINDKWKILTRMKID